MNGHRGEIDGNSELTLTNHQLKCLVKHGSLRLDNDTTNRLRNFTKCPAGDIFFGVVESCDTGVDLELSYFCSQTTPSGRSPTPSPSKFIRHCEGSAVGVSKIDKLETPTEPSSKRMCSYGRGVTSPTILWPSTHIN
jgi:hypothetical protein